MPRLLALVATDAAPPPGSNARVVALLAQARGWLPGDAAIPWIEALLVPERGGRRALLDEAFAAGARDPALLLALARAATREGDAAAALAALNALPPADPAAQDPPLGAALRERAEATQLALSALHRSELSGITVWAASSLPDDASTQLARAVRADLDAAARLLGGPTRPRLVVWVHASLDDFSAATCGTSWSQAFYDGVLHVVLVGQQLDATLLRSARHEALHAQLDFLTPLAPRWLQEGLAQRFAEEPFDPNATRGSAPLTVNRASEHRPRPRSRQRWRHGRCRLRARPPRHRAARGSLGRPRLCPSRHRPARRPSSCRAPRAARLRVRGALTERSHVTPVFRAAPRLDSLPRSRHRARPKLPRRTP
jgi:hypothetical protein